MFKEYKLLCKNNQLTPGGYFLYKEDTPWVLNFATQDTRGGAEVEFVKECLLQFTQYYQEEGITSIAMPRIAAGLGGLDWLNMKDLLIELLDPLPIPIYVYEHFEKFVEGNEAI